MTVDITSGYLLVGLIFLLIMVLDFLFLGYAGSKKFFLYWVYSQIGIILVIVVTVVSGSGQLVSLLIINPLFLVSMFLIYFSVLRIDHEEGTVTPVISGLVLVFAVLLFFYFIVDIFAVRVLVISLTGMCLLFAAAYQLISSEGPGSTRQFRWVRRMMIVSLIGSGISWGVRGFAGIISPEGVTFLDYDLINLIALYVTPPLTLSLNSAFLLLLVYRTRSRSDFFKKKLILEENDAVSAQILANMNHELNTPLGNLLSLTSLITDSTVTGQTAERIVHSMNNNISQIISIAEDRSRILDANINETSESALDAFLEYVNRILSRDINAHGSTYTTDLGSMRFKCPERYLFTILATLSKLILPGRTENSAAVRGNVNLVVLNSTACKYRLVINYSSGATRPCGAVYLDSSAIPAHIGCSDKVIDQKLHWLLLFAGSFFDGRMILDFRSPEGFGAEVFFRVFPSS